ncbi:MAG: hypothetical protein P1U88_18480 [Thalassobaculaceae bacterium]|nr:hypothetical protein [Thalassobaculaceae bacterium]
MEEERLLDGLVSGPDDADYHLDLFGLDVPHATESIRLMLERNRFRAPRTILVTLGEPDPYGKGNLFQPVGRQLLDARRGGIIDAMKPITSDHGPGFWLRTVGNEKASAEPAER